MKKILLAILIFGTAHTHAGDNQNTVKYISLDDEQSVVSQNHRKEHPEVWEDVLKSRIELVKNNQIVEKYKKYSDLIRDAVNIDTLENLQVRDMYIDKNRIEIKGNKVSMPFVLSVMYQESLFKQGTLNTSGILYLEIEDSIVRGVELVYFSDSQKIEEVGRSFGLLDSYGAEFLESVACSVALEHFNNKSELENLIRISNMVTKKNLFTKI